MISGVTMRINIDEYLMNEMCIRDSINYIQIHPTTFYSKKPGRRFLISESVRGEGAYLLNKDGERFTDELKPRDVVTGEICKQKMCIRDRIYFGQIEFIV